jgi:hypothetical protein
MTDEAMLQRLHRLENLEEIRQLYVAYGRSLDADDAAGYASLFARNAKLRLGGPMRADSREEIERLLSGALQPPADGVRQHMHLFGAPHIELDGDTATGDSVWVLILRSPDGPPKLRVGRYADKLVREQSRWCFAERRGFLDIG